MERTTKIVVTAAAAFVAVSILLYLLGQEEKRQGERRRASELKAKTKRLEQEQEKALQVERRRADELEAKARRLELDSSVTAQIKRSLTELEAELYSSRPEVSEEVRRIAQLVDIGQGANAIRCIVKIMDNLITERYAHDLGYKEWSQRGGKDKAKGVEGACFYMLEYAVSLGEINREEVCFFRGIKEIRHKDSHELAVEVEAYLEAPALMIGIGGILNFAKLPPLTERKNL